MAALLRNLYNGFRMMRKSPGFTAAAIVALALGIGATTAIFSVIYATFFAPLPYPDPDQLVIVWSKTSSGRTRTSVRDYLDWKEQSSVFQVLGTGSEADFNLLSSTTPEYVHGGAITAGFYDRLIGEKPWLGRYFLPEDCEPGKDHVVVLSHRLWERLGSDPNILGQQFRLDGELYTVIGVRPAGYQDKQRGSLLVPLVFKPEQINRENHFLVVMGRLKPGVSLARAQAEMDILAKRIAQDHPDTNKGWGISVEALHNDYLSGDTRKTLWLLMGAVGCLLLIACVNVANLLLARASTRQREVAVRTSLGATRRQLLAQFLTESLALAIVGGALGVTLAAGLIKAIVALIPPNALPSEADVKVNLPVLGFTLVATLLAGVLSGSAPAWQASEVDPNEALKEGGRSGIGRKRQRLLRALVVTQFALALTLLAGAGLAIHSFWNLTRVDLGIRRDHVLTFHLPVPDHRFPRPEQVVTFYRQLLDRVKAVPGVSSAEVGTGLPLEGSYFGLPFNIAGRPKGDSMLRQGAGFQMVTPEFFKVFGIQILKGRTLSDDDAPGSARVAMVNEEFVRRYLADVDPLQQRLLIPPITVGANGPGRTGPEAPVEWQIVGVFHDVRNGGIRGRGFPEIYVPFWQSPWPQTAMAVRTNGNPMESSKSVAAAIGSIDPDLAMADVRTVDQIVDESLVDDRFLSLLFGAFAALALALSAVGIYGVVAFSVAQRTHEMGLRMALGAGREQVLGLIMKEGAVLAFAGLVIGLVGACLVGRLMQGILFGVSTIDTLALGAVTMTLLAAGLLASYIPARRASRVDPMVALRYE